MTELEALDVLMVLRAGLPSAYLKLTEADTAAMVALWAEMFSDYPGELVAAAAKTYIWNTRERTFPTPGAIRDVIDDIQRVTTQCAYGSTLREYLGASADKFPAPVREYIDRTARATYEQRTGMIFTSQAEKLAARRAILAGGDGA